MRILHISKYYPPYRGGIEDVCYNIVHELKNHYDQKVICFNDSKNNCSTLWDDVEVIRAGCLFNLARQPFSISIYLIIKETIKEYKPDVIHLHLPNPLVSLFTLLLIPSHTKLILHWHSDIIAQKTLYKFYSKIEKKILRRANKIIVTSPIYLEDSVPLTDVKEKCIVIPNVISESKMQLKKDYIHKVNKIKETYKSPIIFFIGRHVPYKGLEYLIEAEKYIKQECTILIAGKGPLTEELKSKSQSKRIHFLGKIEDSEIPLYMNACTIFAFPSITKNEAFGVALAEAMYCGAVPITFNIKGSGVNWVNLHNVTGLEIANKDSFAYGIAIDKILSDTILLNNLSKNAHERVISKFTLDAIRSQLYELYENINS